MTGAVEPRSSTAPPRPTPIGGTGARGLVGRSVEVEVPATSANLGAGYDVLALALELSNRVRVRVVPEPGISRTVTGHGVGRFGPGSEDRFLRGLTTGLDRLGVGADELASLGWAIEMDNGIPLGRGLGSSAAATVAGLVAAEALSGIPYVAGELLELACDIEGHPDNAAAAWLGGFVLAARVEGHLQALRLEPPEALVAVLFVPQRELATAAMRGVLPAQVPHTDAIFNASRVGLAVAAFATGDLSWLATATEDRLHEPYRAAVFPALPVLVAAARAAGALGACLSGAGSTVIAFARPGQAGTIERAFTAAAASVGEAGGARTLALRGRGTRVVLTSG